MNSCLTITNLNLIFGKRSKQTTAVQNVSLNVHHGEILVIMGASGSGKSSLLRCINGISRNDSAQVRGNVVFHLPRTKAAVDLMSCDRKTLIEIRRKHITMVFQQFGLLPWRTVFENVAYPLELQNIPHTEKTRRVLEKLELVGLASWKSSYPSQLSGGMQQRVGLARALVTDADLLLMDEPFSALDPVNRRALQQEVLTLEEKLKKTIIFVTHDLNEALLLGSRVAIMDAGRILQISSPDEIMANPACDKVRALTAVSL